MIFPELNITENLKALVPIIQGGMAIRVSRAPLAAAVANEGGIGVIAASGLPKQELVDQIRLARSLQKNKNGLIAVNIMFAAREFNMLVKTSMEEGIDLIIFGAGFSRDIFAMGRESNTPIVPIVSSGKLAALSKKLGASAIIAEGKEAGGHLGTDRETSTIIPEIREALDKTPNYPGIDNVPLIAAGGITCGQDILKMIQLGADGVQMATRFVLSKECDVSEKFKNLYLNLKNSDLMLIHSPVGLPARAILTEFTQKLLDGIVAKPTECLQCMKKCTHEFCIIKALDAARKGDMTNGLFFVGEKVKKYTEILSVHEIFEQLQNEAKEFLGTKASC